MRSASRFLRHVRLMSRLAVLVAAVAAAACAPVPPAGPAPAAASLPAPVARLAGQVLSSQKARPPAGSALVVQLVDLAAEPEPRLLAEIVRRDPGTAPHDYELIVPPAALAPAARPALVAKLRDATGRESWRTAQPVVVEPGMPTAPSLRLQHVTDLPPLNEVITQRRGQAYQCGELRMEARFDADHALVLVLPERDLRLVPVPSASGARFVARGHEFRTEGLDRAVFSRPDQPAVPCLAIDARSPWAEAQQRGVRFRAVGHEPAWAVEVERGRQPALRLTTPQASMDFHGVEPLVDGTGYRGRAGGPAVFLRIEPVPCTDTATGTEFPHQAMLQMHGRELRGCGRYLSK